jgi:hypothetical protein
MARKINMHTDLQISSWNLLGTYFELPSYLWFWPPLILGGSVISAGTIHDLRRVKVPGTGPLWNPCYSCMFQFEICSQQVPTRNLQIRVHVYLPRHCCGDWLTFGCFVPMTVMQRICAWPKIWTLSGRLSLMRNVQLMKKNKNILLPHLWIIAKKIGSHDICQLTSKLYHSTSMIYILTINRNASLENINFLLKFKKKLMLD